jgi:hypothetical protein
MPAPRIEAGWSVLLDLDRRVRAAFDAELRCVRRGACVLIGDFSIVAAPDVLRDVRWLAWTDVINAAAWILVVVVLEVEVRLQLRGRLTDTPFGGMRYLKYALYSTSVSGGDLLGGQGQVPGRLGCQPVAVRVYLYRAQRLRLAAEDAGNAGRSARSVGENLQAESSVLKEPVGERSVAPNRARHRSGDRWRKPGSARRRCSVVVELQVVVAQLFAQPSSSSRRSARRRFCSQALFLRRQRTQAVVGLFREFSDHRLEQVFHASGADS